MSLNTQRRSGGLATLAWLLPAALFAHTRGGEAAGLLAGLSHPVSGLDHVLAMVAVGLWGAQLGPPAVWLLPVAFPMVMALGGTLGLVGVHLPGVEIGIALSAIGLGAAVLFEAKPKLGVAAALVGFFAIFHGHAHGTELPPGTAEADRWHAAGRAPFLLETSLPGVFAAGDVRSGSVKRVASAVGEGSMAVSLVHAHIARRA